jgi:hypothetical protein
VAAVAAPDEGHVDAGLARGAALEVRNVNGDLSVRTGAAFSVHFVKHGRGDRDAVRILAEQSPARTLVCVRYSPDADTCGRSGSWHSDSDVTVDLTIVVPPGTRVDAASVNGRVLVETDALVSAQTVNGKVIVDAADADSVHSVNGAVDVTLHDARATGRLSVETVNGSLAVRLASADADVKADVLNGSIQALGLPVSRPQYGPGASVRAQAGRGGRRVELKALNGSITLEKA